VKRYSTDERYDPFVDDKSIHGYRDDASIFPDNEILYNVE
jgi:hypothetical protein